MEQKSGKKFQPFFGQFFLEVSVFTALTLFRRGHLVIKSGVTVYRMCAPVEVLPILHRNCTEEETVFWELFEDPISYAIKSAGFSMNYNNVAPLR